MKKDLYIIIDSGHGVQTPGKQSPDGILKEYKYTREIANYVCYFLQKEGFNAINLMEDNPNDLDLNKRVQTINEYCVRFGTSNCLVVSIHVNAANSNGQWNKATGWSVYVSNNASSNSKELAGCLFDKAVDFGLKTRQYLPNQKYWQQNLAICRDTKCPAILTENMFMDNKDDVKFLLSDKGKRIITQIHVEGIKKYLKAKSLI